MSNDHNRFVALSGLSGLVLFALLNGTGPLSHGLRSAAEAALSERMQADPAARLRWSNQYEGWVERSKFTPPRLPPSPVCLSEDDAPRASRLTASDLRLRVEAMRAREAGMTQSDVAFCLGRSQHWAWKVERDGDAEYWSARLHAL